MRIRKKAKKAEAIAAILEHYFPNPTIPLQHRDPFTLLIAVLLSAQCTDERVNRITPYLFALAATPEAMALLDPEEVQKIIRPCGLSNTKSRAIVNLSKQIVGRYRGKVPEDLGALEELPGVGHKTASVVMIQAFQKPAFPVDTHIHRCAKRWGLSQGKSVKQTEEDLKKLFPETAWAKVHLQIILFARKFCPALRHKKEECPVCRTL